MIRETANNQENKKCQPRHKGSEGTPQSDGLLRCHKSMSACSGFLFGDHEAAPALRERGIMCREEDRNKPEPLTHFFKVAGGCTSGIAYERRGAGPRAARRICGACSMSALCLRCPKSDPVVSGQRDDAMGYAAAQPPLGACPQRDFLQTPAR